MRNHIKSKMFVEGQNKPFTTSTIHLRYLNVNKIDSLKQEILKEFNTEALKQIELLVLDIRSTLSFFQASRPDGVERMVNIAHLPSLKASRNAISLNKKHSYYHQIQGQLYLSGKYK